MPESTRRSKTTLFLLSLLVPVLAAIAVYRLDSFDPAPLPIHEFSSQPVFFPLENPRLLEGVERVGEGQLLGPEDLAYDPNSGVIYTGCGDGWIKRVTVNESAGDSVVESLVNTGGRPLGLALGRNGDVIVADVFKGLLRVTADGKIEALTNEAEGLKIGIIDGVDITDEGMIYFTDASSKHSPYEGMQALLEGRPYGTLMSYDPSTKQTQVLVKDLHFANGVAVSPDQQFVVFCETIMRRCKRYYIQGEKKHSVDIFIDNLPGVPDNIRYDGEGQYWIGLCWGNTFSFDLAQRYPFIRKVMAIMADLALRYPIIPKVMAVMEKYTGKNLYEKYAGVLAVDLEGKPLAHYYDPELSMMTGGIKIGDHLYCTSILEPYIIRVNLTQYPAVPKVVMGS